MVQLAEEGLVNPKRVEVVRRLARRHLVQIDPRYRIMNESFRAFVRHAEPPERVAEWERVGSGEGWARFGNPLYALGAMAIVVLLVTEQESTKELSAVAVAVSTIVGSIRSIFGASSGSKVAGGP